MLSFDVNLRSVYTFRRYGVGHKGIGKFCGMINMSPPMERQNYDKLANKICDVVEKVAKSSMLEAASNLKQTEGTDVGVSVDVTWQKWGFSWLQFLFPQVKFLIVKCYLGLQYAFFTATNK